MDNQAFHDFIKTQLQATTTTYVFGGESYWSYLTNGVVFKTPNQTTLQIDEKKVIPFTIASYESERQALETTDIRKYTLPIFFSIKYEEKGTWIPLIHFKYSSISGYFLLSSKV